MLVFPFNPHEGTTQLVTTGAASAPLVLNAQDKCVRVVNYGATNAAPVRLGIGVPVATAADTVVAPLSTEIFYKGEGVNGIAVIQNTGATTLAISTGTDGT